MEEGNVMDASSLASATAGRMNKILALREEKGKASFISSLDRSKLLCSSMYCTREKRETLAKLRQLR